MLHVELGPSPIRVLPAYALSTSTVSLRHLHEPQSLQQGVVKGNQISKVPRSDVHVAEHGFLREGDVLALR